MIVYVDTEPTGSGSVLLFTGTEEETGDSITFGVDHRPAGHLVDMIDEQGEVPCFVEDWQVIRRQKNTPRSLV